MHGAIVGAKTLREEYPDATLIVNSLDGPGDTQEHERLRSLVDFWWNKGLPMGLLVDFITNLTHPTGPKGCKTICLVI